MICTHTGIDTLLNGTDNLLITKPRTRLARLMLVLNLLEWCRSRIVRTINNYELLQCCLATVIRFGLYLAGSGDGTAGGTAAGMGRGHPGRGSVPALGEALVPRSLGGFHHRAVPVSLTRFSYLVLIVPSVKRAA